MMGKMENRLTRLSERQDSEQVALRRLEKAKRWLREIEDYYRGLPVAPEWEEYHPGLTGADLILEAVPQALEELEDGENPSQTFEFIKDLHGRIALLLAQHTRRGLKTREAASEGGKKVWEEKRALWDKYQPAVNAQHKKNPHLSYTDMLKIVATEFDVSAVTVKRHTKNPKNRR